MESLLLGCEEATSSNQLVVVMEVLLAIGNYMNSAGAQKQVAQGFLLSSVEKVRVEKWKVDKQLLYFLTFIGSNKVQ